MSPDPLEIRNRLKKRRNAHIEALQREMKRLTAEAAKMGARRVILFGSMARGIVGLSSDLDLMIVMDSDIGFLERTAQVYRRLKPEVGTDILVYTPDEMERMHNNPLIRRAITEGQVLYEA